MSSHISQLLEFGLELLNLIRLIADDLVQVSGFFLVVLDRSHHGLYLSVMSIRLKQPDWHATTPGQL
jgi:hypothetical protein